MIYNFKYDIENVTAQVLTDIFNSKIDIRDIISYRITSNLSDITKIDFEVANSDLYINNLTLERLIRLPILDTDGIITMIDNQDTILKIRAQELGWHLTRRIFRHNNNAEFEYNSMNISDLLDIIIASANNDMPFDWIKGDDIATGTVSIKGKYLNHLDVLRLIAKNSANDLYFEGHQIIIGTRGKTVDVSRDSFFFDLLNSLVDLDKYANIVSVIGQADNNGDRNFQERTNMIHNLTYNYEKVVVDNKLNNDSLLSQTADRLLGEFNVSSPSLQTTITIAKFKEYDIKIGDVLKIVRKLGEVKVRGFYRIVKIAVNSDNAKLTLEFSETGRFIPRLLDTSTVFEKVLEKIRELEIN